MSVNVCEQDYPIPKPVFGERVFAEIGREDMMGGGNGAYLIRGAELIFLRLKMKVRRSGDADEGQ
jgi:hypothetical protein